MTMAYARMLLLWQYEPPYDFYNADPATDDAEIATSFLAPEYHYYAVLDGQQALIAYRCFGADARVPGGDYSADALDMGGGLRPDLTGRGIGPQLMRASMDFAQATFAPQAFRVTVAAWNTRAKRACLKVGYQPVSTFHNPRGVPFVILEQETFARVSEEEAEKPV